MVKDRITLEPVITEINLLVEMIKEKGYLLNTDGPLHNVLKIKPPLPFTIHNADRLIQYLDKALNELQKIM